MEINIIRFLQSIKNDFFDTTFWIFSFCASFFAVCIIFAMLFFINKRNSLIFILCTGLNIGVNYILKVLINRPRPYEIDSHIINSFEALGKSFPSGHMVCATTIAFLFFLFFYKTLKFNMTKIIFILALVVYLLGVAVSRMYFGQHYLSDLFGGCVLAIGLCFVFVFVLKRIFKKIFKQS